MSQVYFKFKSAKAYDTITFDGLGTSVFDVKREILLNKKLGRGAADFDLVIYNAQNNAEYKDDSVIIPRNTQILASRKPPANPKFPSAQKYLNTEGPAVGNNRPTTNTNMGSGGGSLNAKSNAMSLVNNGKQEINASSLEQNSAFLAMSEEERVNAMSANFWGQQEKVLANQKPVFRGGYRGGGAMGRGMGRGAPEQPAEQPDYSSTSPFSYEKTPHPNYICYRCGKKGGPDGHFFNKCPTLGNPDYDGQKLKRTTGIPKMFLKTVESTESLPNSSDTDKNKHMVTSTGEIVISQPNQKAWEKHTSKTNLQNIPAHLQCPLCKNIMNEAVHLPCCPTKHYCDDCIRTSLLDSPNRFKCPSENYNCSTSKGKSTTPDALIVSTNMRTQIREYLLGTSSPKMNNETLNGSPKAAPQQPKSYQDISQYINPAYRPPSQSHMINPNPVYSNPNPMMMPMMMNPMMLGMGGYNSGNYLPPSASVSSGGARPNASRKKRERDDEDDDVIDLSNKK